MEGGMSARAASPYTGILRARVGNRSLAPRRPHDEDEKPLGGWCQTPATFSATVQRTGPSAPGYAGSRKPHLFSRGFAPTRLRRYPCGLRPQPETGVSHQSPRSVSGFCPTHQNRTPKACRCGVRTPNPRFWRRGDACRPVMTRYSGACRPAARQAPSCWGCPGRTRGWASTRRSQRSSATGPTTDPGADGALLAGARRPHEFMRASFLINSYEIVSY